MTQAIAICVVRRADGPARTDIVAGRYSGPAAASPTPAANFAVILAAPVSSPVGRMRRSPVE
jgi:hypothetical protein